MELLKEKVLEIIFLKENIFSLLIKNGIWNSIDMAVVIFIDAFGSKLMFKTNVYPKITKENMGCRHSSVDSPVPSVLLPQV